MPAPMMAPIPMAMMLMGPRTLATGSAPPSAATISATSLRAKRLLVVITPPPPHSMLRAANQGLGHAGTFEGAVPPRNIRPCERRRTDHMAKMRALIPALAVLALASPAWAQYVPGSIGNG